MSFGDRPDTPEGLVCAPRFDVDELRGVAPAPSRTVELATALRACVRALARAASCLPESAERVRAEAVVEEAVAALGKAETA